MELRGQHWTDAPHPSLAGQRKRSIRNWSNFKTPGQEFKPANPGAGTAQGAPPYWAGAFDFSLQSLDGALQVFARDAMDVGNRAMVGVRSSKDPGCWINFKALNVNPVDAVITNNGKTITYPGLWPGCDLVYTVGAHKLKEVVRIWDKSIAPEYFEWTIKAAPGCPVDIAGDVLRLRDGDGVSVIHTAAPWGEDSATTAPTVSGKQHIACTFTQQDDYQGNVVGRLTPSPEGMAAAVGAVELDPTTEISGPTDIDDAFCASGGDQTKNYGGHANVIVRGGTRNGFIRVATGAIPVAATYTDFTMTGYANIVSNTNPVSRQVNAANVWYEGVSSGSVEVDAISWYGPQTVTLFWADLPGGDGAGDVTGAASPAWNPTVSGVLTAPLTASWVDSWINGGAFNNGFRMRTDAGRSMTWDSADHPSPTQAITLDISYAAASTFNPHHYYYNLLGAS